MIPCNAIYNLAKVIKPEYDQSSGSSWLFAGDRTEKHIKVHYENENEISKI